MRGKLNYFALMAMTGLLGSFLVLLATGFSEVHAQGSRTVTGIVYSQNDGNPLAGVSVTVRNGTGHATTDDHGRFSISLAAGEDILLFSHLAYEPQEVQARGRTTLVVRMDERLGVLDEAVVVGYGTVNRKNLTGSVSTIKPDNISQLNNTSFDSYIQGRAAGVHVTSADGSPGGSVDVKIRGSASINASAEPLYVIDGFPIVNVSGETTGSINGSNGILTNPLTSLNPSDIESIDILKDASATAIYGSRGANGVVIITTKKGVVGKVRVQYDNYFGGQKLTKKMQMLSHNDYLNMIEDAHPNQQVSAYIDTTSGMVKTNLRDSKAYIDWQDEIFTIGNVQNHQLSLSGGSADGMRYNLSLGYHNNSGIIKNSNFERISLKLSLQNRINKVFSVGLDVNGAGTFTRGNYSGGGQNVSGGVTYAALRYRPVLAEYVDDSWNPDNMDLSILDNDELLLGNTSNPLSFVNDLKQDFSNYLGLLNGYIDAHIANGLVFKTRFGADLRNGQTDMFYPKTTALGRVFQSRAMRSSMFQQSLLNENTLTYDKQLNKHRINGVAGFTFQKYTLKGTETAVNNFAIETNGYYNLAAGLEPVVPINSPYNDWSIASVLARVNYSFDDKYLLTVSARRDGSSKFGADNKWATFPSAAIAWKVKNESFLKDHNLLSDLKLRASYGVTGNQGIPSYRSLATLNNVIYSYGSNLQSGVIVGRLENANLRWEKVLQSDIGLDMGLFDNRLMLTVDYYSKKTKDLLLNFQLPATSGFTSALRNFGDIRQSGLEIALNTTIVRKRDFSWNMNVNISFEKNKVLEIGEPGELLVNGGVGQVSIVKEGLPIGQFYGLVWDGIYQLNDFEYDSAVPHESRTYSLKAGVPYTTGYGTTQQPGDIKFKDLSGPEGIPDGVIDQYDRTEIGNPNPSHYGGITNTLQYKQFDLNVFLNWSFGNEMYNWNTYRFGLPNIQLTQNYFATVANYWTPDNPTDQMPRLQDVGSGMRDANFANSFMVEDGSFLRINNITVGYMLPKTTVSKLGIQKFRMFLSLDNLHVWTKYSGYDPEVNISRNPLAYGQDNSPYPRSRGVRAGLNIIF